MNKLKRTLKACVSLFRIRVAECLQYRAASLAGASVGIFWALMEITLYTVFYTYGNLKNASALSLAQIASYVWVGQMLWPLLPMSVDDEILKKITSGDIGIELCRPMGFYAYWFAKSSAGRLGHAWWRSLITLAAGLLLPASYKLAPPASAVSGVLFCLSVASAFLLASAYGMLATAVRLGITWGEGPTYMMLLLGGVLSGNYLPLQLWPDFLQGFLFLQPFAGYLDLPARLYVGSMRPQGALPAIAVQLFWAAAFIMSGKLLTDRKLKHIVVQGG